jgi:TolA-binding protein
MFTVLMLICFSSPLQAEESALTVWQDRATSAAKKGHWEKTLIHLRKISLHRALNKDEEELIAYAMHKAGHHAEAAVRYHRIVKANPRSFSATYQLALCLHEMQQYLSAEKYFRLAPRCTAHHEKSPAYPTYEGEPVNGEWRDTLVETSYAECLVSWGGVLIGLKEMKEGQKRLDRGIELLEKRPAARTPVSLKGTREFLYAQAFYEMSQFNKARELYVQYIHDYPKHSKVLDGRFRAAICVERSDDPEHCFSLYEKLIQDHPKSQQAPDSLIRMGLFRFSKKDYWAARLYFQRLLKSYPKHESAEKMDFKFGLALILDEEYEAAGEHYEEFFRRRPQSALLPAALYWAGDAYMKAGMIEKSGEMFQKVEKLYKDSKWAKYSKGRLTSPIFGGKETK